MHKTIYYIYYLQRQDPVVQCCECAETSRSVLFDAITVIEILKLIFLKRIQMKIQLVIVSKNR